MNTTCYVYFLSGYDQIGSQTLENKATFYLTTTVVTLVLQEKF